MKIANLSCFALFLFSLAIVIPSCGGGSGGCGSTPPSQPPSDAPSALVASAQSSNSIRLTWTDNSNSETVFKIEQGSSDSGPFTEIASLEANGCANYKIMR